MSLRLGVRQAISPLSRNVCSRLLGTPVSVSKIDMQASTGRHQFASDNTAGICPEAFAALQEANADAAVPSYGDDKWYARLRERVCEIFEKDCDVHLVFNGTAANALALAQLCRSFHSIVCPDHAHIQTDECGAPEFFSGGSKLLLVGGDAGKIDIEQAKDAILNRPELHSHKPRVISITQATEFGTIYKRDEIAEVSELAQAHEMFLQMDGARFANAVAWLKCAPKEITWEVGVDVLCFGGTKNGLAAGELAIFFDRELSRDFDYRLKQAGQLASKTRFLAAPWLGLLGNDVWLKNAERANAAARKLAKLLRDEAKIDIVFPVESNAVFVRLSKQIASDLQKRGWHFYKFIEPDIYRIMCAWPVKDEDIADFVGAIKSCAKR